MLGGYSKRALQAPPLTGELLGVDSGLVRENNSSVETWPLGDDPTVMHTWAALVGFSWL